MSLDSLRFSDLWSSLSQYCWESAIRRVGNSAVFLNPGGAAHSSVLTGAS